MFRHYAHAFRVYVPAAWVPSPAAQALLQRAIDLQRPAHTSFSLVLVEPRFRIGDQSTLGLDSVIGGDNAPWRVSCAADPAALRAHDRQRTGLRFDARVDRGRDRGPG